MPIGIRMIRINQIKITPEDFAENLEQCLYKKVAKILSLPQEEIISCKITKKSIDARKKPDIFFILTLDVEIKQEKRVLKSVKNPNVSLLCEEGYRFPLTGTKKMNARPIIVGAGPAGLFCAYYLAKNGFRPIVLERGEDADTRKETVETFWNHGILNPESNVQFGEGGAGTFSDGKLNTLVKDKYGRNREVLKTFVHAGAPEEILYEAKPHLGTDILIHLVKNMRQEIVSHGGEVLFQKKVTDLIIKEEKICGVKINDKEELACDALILAVGHSARDTFEMIYKKNLIMEAKSFAVGFRVEHKQTMINKSQYGIENPEYLPAAAYKLTAQTDGNRGVYSFCMCPGGYVVNASSEAGRLAVNGMSYSKRDAQNANSAIIVSITPEDFCGLGPLAGVEFQRALEEKTYQLGNGEIPIQFFGDYLKNKTSIQNEMLYEPQIKGKYCFSNLRDLLPEAISVSFIKGMERFDKLIPGFADAHTILSGIESRTSSPLRMIRNDKTLQSNITGIYPCGEGAGYAGGITSSAMDGIKIAEAIGEYYLPLQ